MTKRAGASATQLLGYVTAEELAGLYAGGSLFVSPSLYEGFGLPVLEAMQSGAPVVTSRLSSLPEVAGDAAEYIDDPSDVYAIERALTTVIASAERRDAMRARGLHQAAGFSWARSAREMRALFAAMPRGD